MAKNSAIPWADATWNPWIGCDKVSEGCRNCYAKSWAKRTGIAFQIHRTTPSTFCGPLAWQRSVIFPCSLSDFCHPGADEWRADAWDIIRKTPHTYLILTKRPERLHNILCGLFGWPLPNVWIGVTVENQKAADERIPYLFHPIISQAAGHFISMEPLLESVNLEPHLHRSRPGYAEQLVTADPPVASNMVARSALDWVIIGGESGPKARPMAGRWLRQVLDSCKRWNIPAFVKQVSQHDGSHFRDPNSWPLDVRIQQIPAGLKLRHKSKGVKP